MIKKISDRISHKKHKDYTTIVISPRVERWKETLLLTWILAWTFCGSVFLYYLFSGDFNKDERLVLLIISIFWAYFEYRIVKTFLWRKYGIEYIKINNKHLTVKQSIFSYGKAKEYPVKTINTSKIESLKQDPKSFSKIINSSFWVIGEGTVRIEHQNEYIYIGHQLENHEANKLATLLKQTISHYKHKK